MMLQQSVLFRLCSLVPSVMLCGDKFDFPLCFFCSDVCGGLRYGSYMLSQKTWVKINIQSVSHPLLLLGSLHLSDAHVSPTIHSTLCRSLGPDTVADSYFKLQIENDNKGTLNCVIKNVASSTRMSLCVITVI